MKDSKEYSVKCEYSKGECIGSCKDWYSSAGPSFSGCTDIPALSLCLCDLDIGMSGFKSWLYTLVVKCVSFILYSRASMYFVWPFGRARGTVYLRQNGGFTHSVFLFF